MGEYIKTFNEFITEAAKWDDTSKRFIDKYFVSFHDDEKYEVRDFIYSVVRRINNEDIDKEELLAVINDCKDKIAHNHPRRDLLICVLSHYGIEIKED
ncbi:MAG: hypothetical protein H6598_10260 [Flavobacteriales bacterium]|nr:hypothetical protein [Flavobacteriales bacterium]